MSLSGNLRDFDISYIFQIISQEGKTGKLILSEGNARGAAIFKKGRIVSAGIRQKDLKTMVLQYLRDERKLPEQEVKRIDGKYGSDFHALAEDVLASHHMTEQEMRSIVEVGLEDLTCGLFLWKMGSYRFEVLGDVDNFQILDIALTSDTVTIEAARRVDEWARMCEYIRPHTVFLVNDTVGPKVDLASSPSPFDNIADYLMGFIDGSSSVEFLCSRVFLSEYKVYEALYELFLAEKVTPLSDKLSTSINAALQRKIDARDTSLSTTFLTAVVSILLAIGIIGSGYVLHHGVLHDKNHVSAARLSAHDQEARPAKTKAASLFYYAKTGQRPSVPSDLVDSEILTRRDLADRQR